MEWKKTDLVKRRRLSNERKKKQRGGRGKERKMFQGLFVRNLRPMVASELESSLGMSGEGL